ncbi:hypothetical protein [Massilia niabensis]|uniref:Uncharacterized protein n=1 Tax=Massilia niabensis TaxID=544910 RepID=A0ABW0L5S4_9BURK
MGALAHLHSLGLPDASPRLARFLGAFDTLRRDSRYKDVPDAARVIHDEVLRAAGEPAARALLLAALFQAVCGSLAGTRLPLLPPRVLNHQLRQFARIVAHDDAFAFECSLASDAYMKELGLARLRLYAGASNLIDPQAGVARSVLWKGGPLQLLRRALLFARIGGFKPYFEIHAHKLYMEEFSAEGRRECYRCCADLYALHPEMLGMYAGSWFYDPAVARLSPHLAYLRDDAVAGGCACLFVAHDEQAVSYSTAKSEKRRAAWAAGTYRPATYALVWPRRAQIAWARREPSPIS